jgi:hypothetical protein
MVFEAWFHYKEQALVSTRGNDMFSRVDRVQLCTNEPDNVASQWVKLLDATESGQDTVKTLGANRTTLNVGNCQLEILSPIGKGPVQSHLEKYRGGPFAAGFAVDDLEKVQQALTDKKVDFTCQGDQLFVSPEGQKIDGLRLVITGHREAERHGIMQNLYEVTHLTDKEEEAAQRFAEIYQLDAHNFVPIRSDNYGYDGCLTLIKPEELDRIEIINPFDLDKTMGRFFAKSGPSLYMCYGECDDLPLLRNRLLEHAPNDWTGPQEGPIDGLFVHPKALGGTMLGVSRTTFAWSWSGSPDRIQPDNQQY